MKGKRSKINIKNLTELGEGWEFSTHPSNGLNRAATILLEGWFGGLK